MLRPGRLALILAFFARSSAGLASDPVEFNRDIRPILSENCFLCHGPDKSHRKAGLRLDDRASALAKEAIVPGRPDASELIARILSDDPEEVMPPPDSTKVLTPAQKDTLRRWVAEGANYQAHWAYEPIRKPPIPTVQNPGWIKNPVDAFVLKALEDKGLRPSREADRRTLLRRLSLDLIGLPPTVEEVRAFEADPSPDAYEKAVDRLLASPHYGERMAIPWLDLARFSDTVGYHGDQNQRIFPYRDYVINAFNNNLPFDRFTLEQLAGDLLPDPTPEQRVATGFNRLNMMTREGGAQPKEYLAKYAGDRVRTVAITWLGSTMGCAECHDHKFDPFTARDFYRMAAFFGDVKQWGVYSEYTYTPNPELRGYSNDHPFPPEVEVDSPPLKRRLDRLNAQVREVFEAARTGIAADPARSEAFTAWTRENRSFLSDHPDGWRIPAIDDVSDLPPEKHAARQEDGSLLLDPKAKPKDGWKFRLDLDPGHVASIRLEVIPWVSEPGKAPRSTPVNVQLSAEHKPASGRSSRLAFAHADADHKEIRYANGSPVVGVQETWRTSAKASSRIQTAIYVLDAPISASAGDHLVLNLKGDGLARVRFAASPLAWPDPRRPALDGSLAEAIRAESPTPAQTLTLTETYVRGTGADPSALALAHRLDRDRRECGEGRAWSLVTEVREPLPTRVLPRGNWQDESGELVEPGTPGFLPQPDSAGKRRLGRLDLARWLTAPENPLTPRVFANRLWKLLFGNGLSAVMEDVGAQGEAPSHPELLDWLASEFRDGWDVKRLVKLLVMSNTYRQEARLRPDLRESDPNNRRLASQNPRRLEAELIRDNALAISGLLNPEIGGPSVRPYQPPGYYAVLQFPDRDYLPQRDDRQYRRGVYTHWQRTFLQPMMANFDAPPREECTASRVVANTPQQALTLLNDPTFVEAARVLAGMLLAKDGLDDAGRINLLFETALVRLPKESERASLLAFLGRQRAEAVAHPDEVAKLEAVGLAPNRGPAPAAERAAWIETCRVVLNLHETITRY